MGIKKNKFSHYQNRSIQWLNNTLIDRIIDGHTDCVNELIKLGANVNAVAQRGGWPALLLAAHYYRTDIVDLLIQNGADINSTNRQGETALMRTIHDEKSYNYYRSLGVLTPYRLLSCMTYYERQSFANVSVKSYTF